MAKRRDDDSFTIVPKLIVKTRTLRDVLWLAAILGGVTGVALAIFGVQVYLCKTDHPKRGVIECLRGTK